MTPEQVAASRSPAPCICGHREMDHVVPLGDEPRECFPPAVLDWDLRTGEEVVVDFGGCACEHFQAVCVPCGEWPCRCAANHYYSQGDYGDDDPRYYLG